LLTKSAKSANNCFAASCSHNLHDCVNARIESRLVELCAESTRILYGLPQYLLFGMSNQGDCQFLDCDEWRKWLEANHSLHKEIWVIIHKKNSGEKGLKYDEAVEEAICFGWIDGKMQRVDNIRFRLRFSPRKKNSIWSRSNRDRAEKTIQAGKMATSGFEAVSEAKRSGNWDRAYSSNMALTIPKDLTEALKENVTAWESFKRYPNSKKLQCIYWINNAKKDATRRKRITTVVMKAGTLNPEQRLL
jgi:uncharacterized protein YdeI (YjbR/CyaY-like superfamily)